MKKRGVSKDKEASLNLSIQAIVIVVIAFVVLGLGLSFVRGQFKSISETSSSVQEQIRQQILEDLRTGDKKLSFPATSLNVDKGGAQDIAIGVKNTLAAGDLKFIIAMETLKRQGGVEGVDVSDQVEYFFLEGPFTLKVTDAEAYNIKILGSGDKGTYLVSLKILEADSDGNPVDENAAPYAEKSFFVNII
jgi:type II secretory pathway pseudopilin PulG